jgi:hypothetical protein
MSYVAREAWRILSALLTGIEFAIRNMEGDSSKIQKSCQITSVVQEQNMIDNKLPESLINRILSFLPTKAAVRTCVLSNRWMDRWTSITQFDINDSDLSYDYNPICCYCQNICIDYCHEYDKVSILPLDILFDRSKFILPSKKG